jgi:hypothetical protein
VSFKDDVKFVKDELSSDEKVLESVFKLETIYKKHKIKIFGLLAVAIIGFGGVITNDIIKESNLNSANLALLALQKDSSDADAKAILKSKNQSLYSLYRYSQAVKNSDIKVLTELSTSQNKIIADLSNYHLNMFQNKNADSKYYKNLSIIGDAFVSIKDNKKSLADGKLTLIEQNSELYKLSTIMRHQTIEITK